jgi:hypothetical protein
MKGKEERHQKGKRKYYIPRTGPNCTSPSIDGRQDTPVSFTSRNKGIWTSGG